LSACITISQVSCAQGIVTDTKTPDKHLKLQSPAITEASGLAVSPTNPDFLWVINDSGGTPEIHLAGTDGTDHGKLTLKDTKNIDWEDLASFTLDGKPYLLLADTGDNNSRRETCVLHILREPTLPDDGKPLNLTTLPDWQIRFRYEDGPRDCEAVAVDAANKKIILISKRTKPPEVHELPLRAPSKRGILTTRKLGLTEVRAPVGNFIPFIDQPTGLDISPDGSLAAAVTYYGVFLFPRQPEESWADAFARKPVDLGPHHLGQAESVAFSKDGKTLRVISEGKNSPIKVYQTSAEGSH